MQCFGGTNREYYGIFDTAYLELCPRSSNWSSTNQIWECFSSGKIRAILIQLFHSRHVNVYKVQFQTKKWLLQDFHTGFL